MSDATGTDIQKFNYACKKALDCNLVIGIEGEGFTIKLKTNALLGKVRTVNDLFNFLCGYEAGFDKGLSV